MVQKISVSQFQVKKPISYDVDLIVTYGKKSDLKALQKDALIGQIPAIKAGHVVFIEPSSDLAAGATPSILSIPYNLDHYLKVMNKALS